MLSCLPSARRPCIPRSHRFARSRPLTLCEGGVDFPPHSHPSPSLQRKGRGAKRTQGMPTPVIPAKAGIHLGATPVVALLFREANHPPSPSPRGN